MSNEKTAHVVRRTLADGTVKTYRYASRAPRVPVEGTVSAIVDAWQRSVEWKALKPSTQTNYVIYLKPLFHAYKLVLLTDIQRRHLMAIRDEIAASRGHGAALAFCRTMSAFFGWAVEREYLETSPAMRLATKLQRGELPTWRDDHAQKAMAELTEPYRRAVVLAYYTGQRRGDLCRLRWRDYDGEFIHLVQEKTEREVQIPVLPALREELEAWKNGRRSMTILEFLGKPWTPEFLSKRLPAELVRLGLPPLGLHGLRKLCAVCLAEAGCTPHEIAAITGHTTLAMIQHYTKGVSQRSLAEQATAKRLIWKTRL
jgi:integrase